jgi:DnaJ-class molecular chaperone
VAVESCWRRIDDVRHRIYAVLGQRNDPEDIKKAYRKLALQYHPDGIQVTAAERNSKELRSYQVLSDQETPALIAMAWKD